MHCEPRYTQTGRLRCVIFGTFCTVDDGAHLLLLVTVPNVPVYK